ncbi:hypothetical protein DL770_000051 [Monosporascus sp. CRB-9-2]|nr:hypothetical protein DL770_000051 [Monosporascus sp. CRB-9-2]
MPQTRPSNEKTTAVDRDKAKPIDQCTMPFEQTFWLVDQLRQSRINMLRRVLDECDSRLFEVEHLYNRGVREAAPWSLYRPERATAFAIYLFIPRTSTDNEIWAATSRKLEVWGYMIADEVAERAHERIRLAKRRRMNSR